LVYGSHLPRDASQKLASHFLFVAFRDFRADGHAPATPTNPIAKSEREGIMENDRRDWLKGLGALAGVSLLAADGEAAQREAKPLTTAGLAKSLLTLADKAERQGMTVEAQVIYRAVKEVLKGSPVPCDTDTDCERKNPRLAARGGKQ
jgi:hypothetical protein